MFQELQGGKYKGKTLAQVVLTDPDYFFYGYSNGYFKTMAAEALEIYRKATSIRIPGGYGAVEVEYVLDPMSRKFAYCHLVEKSEPPSRSANKFRKDVLDLSVPHQFAGYDKSGGKVIVEWAKAKIFKNPKIYLTKKVCEAFFKNEGNFNFDYFKVLQVNQSN